MTGNCAFRQHTKTLLLQFCAFLQHSKTASTCFQINDGIHDPAPRSPCPRPGRRPRSASRLRRDRADRFETK
jgi:hypothetical protein